MLNSVLLWRCTSQPEKTRELQSDSDNRRIVRLRKMQKRFCFFSIDITIQATRPLNMLSTIQRNTCFSHDISLGNFKTQRQQEHRKFPNRICLYQHADMSDNLNMTPMAHTRRRMESVLIVDVNHTGTPGQDQAYQLARHSSRPGQELLISRSMDQLWAWLWLFH